MTETIHLLNAKNDLNGFKIISLFISSVVNSHSNDVRINFSNCSNIGIGTMTVLGGLYYKLHLEGKSLSFIENTISPTIKKQLLQKGILHLVDTNYRSYNSFTAIPFKKFELNYIETEAGQAEWFNYISQWLMLKINDLPTDLGELASLTWEIFHNAEDHTSSKPGFFSCGGYLPKDKILKLTVLDFGHGIPYNIKKYLDTSSIPASVCLMAIFEQGLTTRKNKVGGVGLKRLREFVNNNDCTIDVASHDAIAMLRNTGANYQVLPASIPGTLVNFELKL